MQYSVETRWGKGNPDVCVFLLCVCVCWGCGCFSSVSPMMKRKQTHKAELTSFLHIKCLPDPSVFTQSAVNVHPNLR